MSILIADSVCVDCKWKDTCQSLKRINNIGSDNRKFKADNHKNAMIEVIIRYCNLKNLDRSYK